MLESGRPSTRPSTGDLGSKGESLEVGRDADSRSSRGETDEQTKFPEIAVDEATAGRDDNAVDGRVDSVKG